MATIEKALQIAATAHAGQKDKEGKPYILHALRVMMGCPDPDAQIVGVLHDVVEDTAVTHDDLAAAGFSPEVLAAVRLVTHEKSEPYADYVIRCKANRLAKQVKLADLTDNSRLDRTMLRPARLDHDLTRIRRYGLSYKFLIDQLTEEDYRRCMVGAE
jgi:(p)ppGpp synthase/HD superfamily hydrolase